MSMVIPPRFHSNASPISYRSYLGPGAVYNKEMYVLEVVGAGAGSGQRSQYTPSCFCIFQLERVLRPLNIKQAATTRTIILLDSVESVQV